MVKESAQAFGEDIDAELEDLRKKDASQDAEIAALKKRLDELGPSPDPDPEPDPDPVPNRRLFYSTNSDRSNPIILEDSLSIDEGQEVYIFTNDNENIDPPVRFVITGDETLDRNEYASPYDMIGGTSRGARPWTPGEGDYKISAEDDDGPIGEATVQVRADVAPPPPPPPPPPPVDDGFTKLEPSTDTRKVYVSSKLGNDSNDGTIASPVRTLWRGHDMLRPGMPDWLLLHCGDVWEEDFRWNRSGRNERDRCVVTYYGDVTKGRPQIGAFQREGGQGNHPVSNFAMIGIKLQRDVRNPANGPDAPESHEAYGGIPHGILWLDGAENILIEDCYLRWWEQSIVFNGFRDRMHNVVVRRNIVLDAYHKDHRPQGLFCSKVDGLVVEENTFDHNGWHNSSLFGRTIYNHNVYLASSNGHADVSRNILTRGSSHGLQLRCSGQADHNFMWGNAIPFFIGGTEHKRDFARAIRNIVAGGTHLAPRRRDQGGGSLNLAWGIELKSSEDGLYQQNMVLDRHASKGPAGIILTENDARPSKTLVRDNIIRNWDNEDGEWIQGGGSSFTLIGNRRITSGPSIESVIGQSIHDFLLDVRNRPLREWRTEQAAEVICDNMWEALKDL